MAFFRKKKKSEEVNDGFEERIRSIELTEPKKNEYYLVNLCEQMIDASKEYESAKKEYDLVTNYLSDIQMIEDFPEEERKELNEIAGRIYNLTRERNEFLQTENKISDAQFLQMQEVEEEMPAALNRFKKNEDYLEVVKKDLRYIEGEKTEWEIVRQECVREQRQLRQISVMMLVLFVLALILLVLVANMVEIDTQLVMVILSFFAVAMGAYVLIKYQDCAREIKKSDHCKNRAIVLENRLKLKYVNTKNAVDYACERFHVKNAYELSYIYEEYLEAVKQREKFRDNNDQLEYYNKELIYTLEKQMLYDAKVWLNYTNAIIDPREMVELKHELITRRQKLRARIEYNTNVMDNTKKELLKSKKRLDEPSAQIDQIINKIEQLKNRL